MRTRSRSTRAREKKLRDKRAAFPPVEPDILTTTVASHPSITSPIPQLPTNSFTTANMQFFATAILALAGVAIAAPVVEERQVYVPCSGLYGSSQCCATDVLGIANLDCGQPPSTPGSADEFSAVCSAIGQRARCCVLPILDQGILCNTPAGVQE
jgi:hypothetical protein